MNTGRIDKNKWEIGFVVGGGIERAFGNGWTGKVEYLFMGFDVDIDGTIITGGFAGSPITLSGETYVHLVRLGLNRRFSTGP